MPRIPAVTRRCAELVERARLALALAAEAPAPALVVERAP